MVNWIVIAFIIMSIIGTLIIILGIYIWKSEGIIRPDIKENMKKVYNCRSFEGRMNGHFEWLVVECNKVDNGYMLKMIPTDFKTENKDLSKDKKEIVVEEFVEDNRFFDLGTSLGTEREKAFIFPSDMDSMNPNLKRTPFGKLVIYFISLIDSLQEQISIYKEHNQEILNTIDQMKLSDPLQEDNLRRLRMLANNDMMRQDNRERKMSNEP